MPIACSYTVQPESARKIARAARQLGVAPGVVIDRLATHLHIPTRRGVGNVWRVCVACGDLFVGKATKTKPVNCDACMNAQRLTAFGQQGKP